MTSPKVTPKNGVDSPRNANASPPRGPASDAKPENPTVKGDSGPEIAQPLAPPPPPPPAARSNTAGDYFGTQHHSLTTELNPFEHQFAGGPSTAGESRTPGGTKLPSVAALASPAGPFFGSGTPGFFSSLRSGPLSPAMLSAPKAQEDYFSEQHSLRGGFTPNESGLRSGLTPGGSGSMFPEPSPGTTAMFNSLQSGGVTPAALDFHRTALSIASKTREPTIPQSVTSQPQELTNGSRNDTKLPGQFDDANDAANGLFMLAQSRNVAPSAPNHYTLAPQQVPIQHSHPQPPQPMQMPNQQMNGSPSMAPRNVHGSTSTASGRAASVVSNGYSDDNDTQQRPNTRGKKRTQSQVNGQGKAKAASTKKTKANGGASHARTNSMDDLNEPPSPDDSQMQEDPNKDEYNAQGKKLTDEEKRRNFLERNRVAALKCRQRKKQWLANLQQKVELYSNENDALQQTLASMKNEIVNLRTLLLAHKDCPISAHQGIQNMQLNGPPPGGPVMNGYDDHQMSAQNPYGMAEASHHQQGM